MQKADKTPDIIADAKLELLDVLEEFGAVATLLREAYSDHENENDRGARMAASDAVDALLTIERKCARIASSVARWANS